MKRTFRLSKKRLLVVAVALLSVAAVLALLFTLKYWENRDSGLPSVVDPTSPEDRAEIYVDGEKYALNKQVEAVLFLGIDSYETTPTDMYLNGQQADLLMLLVLNHQTRSYTVLQINRDTVASFRTLGVTGDNGGMMTAPLALSHAYGTGANDSSRNTTKAVSNLLYGVDIPHFATIRMNAISVLNDAVGGVEVELLDDFTVLDPSFTKGACVTLKGEQAVAYVQYRAQLENNTNLDRMKRQQQYMSAWASQLRNKLATDDRFVSSVAMDIADSLVTDLSVDQMNALGEYFTEYTSNGILDVAGESVKGKEYMEFHVDEEALQKQVLDLFYTKAD